MTPTTPPRTRPARTIRLERPPGTEGVAIVCITVGEESTFYTVVEVECQIGGRGFAMHKTGLGDLYHVRVGQPEECSCECRGFLYRTWCRHVLGLLALIEQGKL